MSPDEHSAFWDDHARDLENPEYARAFAAESAQVNTIDALVNRLDESRGARAGG